MIRDGDTGTQLPAVENKNKNKNQNQNNQRFDF